MWEDARELLRQLQDAGARVSTAMKRRDRREPRALEKERMEDELYALFIRYWARQAKAVREYLKQIEAARKSEALLFDDGVLKSAGPLPENPDDEIVGQVMGVVVRAMRNGIQLFEEFTKIGFDTTAVNYGALDFAKDYSYNLVSKIDATTRDAISKAVSKFVETPGFTIGNVMDGLPFGDARSRMIAVTEVTRAYAEGQRAAGHELQQQFPGVRIIKRWYTNVDDSVCEICDGLDGNEVDLDDEFEGGYMEPPAHVGCRCWMETNTRL
jgi:hypothetical protein